MEPKPVSPCYTEYRGYEMLVPIGWNISIVYFWVLGSQDTCLGWYMKLKDPYSLD